MSVFKSGFALLGFAVLSGCVAPTLPDLTDVASFMAPAQPAMRWDHREEGSHWTNATLVALAGYDAELAAAEPADIARWCPGYPDASLAERRAFWSGLLSAIAEYESTWNPTASGAGGKYIGLMQISPSTAKTHDCAATSSATLKDGAANLTCAVKIIAAQVGRDGVVSGDGNRGVARDWGPMKSQSKRSEMAAWTSEQSYCR